MIKSKITLGRVVEKYFYILTLIRSSVLYFNVYKNINKISKLYSLPLFKDFNLKNSDTLFILGSSNGINSITKDQWAHIREHDSFALNTWAIHEHIPDYYMIERGSDVMFDTDKMITDLIIRKKEVYNKTKIIIKDSEHAVFKGVSDILAADIEVNLLNNFLIPASNVNCLLKFKKIWSFVRRLFPSSLILKTHGSIFSILDIAKSIGYKKVVLCGVDLLNQGYFWEDAKYSDINKDLLLYRQYKLATDCNYSNKTHRTNDSNVHTLTIIDAIKTYYLDEKTDMDIYVLYKETALYPLLKKYEFKK